MPDGNYQGEGENDSIRKRAGICRTEVLVKETRHGRRKWREWPYVQTGRKRNRICGYRYTWSLELEV